MFRLPIKPLSLNHAYRGRRFDTAELKQFHKDMARILPNITVPSGKLSVHYRFGVSSKNADGDNLIKCAQDAIATKYQFNDKIIYEWHVWKEDVPKGQEYIEFMIFPA